MAFTADVMRGNTETIILRRLLDGDSYAYDINKRILALSGGEFSLQGPTLYLAFRRLEKDGCVSSYWGGEKDGARRRYYRITEAGCKEYARRLEEWRRSQRIIDTLLDDTEDMK